MKNVEKKSFLKSQCGGMLVELMLSITIAAIILPFIVRYQQNAISRAKNIAVAKQIEMVQNALERYINGEKSQFLQHIGNHNFSVKISDLIDYGLPQHIVKDYGQDYQLSVLKSGSGDNVVLQGVVVFDNKDISAFRTREIANLGNGRYGFVDGKDVYGGFNVFQTSTASLGLENDITTGIVGTTDPTATSRNSMYLWRAFTDSDSDSTMRSNLNLNGQDVTNIDTLSVTGSFAFFGTLNIGDITNLSTLEFKNTSLLTGVSYTTKDLKLINSGNIYGDYKHTIYVNGDLDIITTGTFGKIETGGLSTLSNLELNGFQIIDNEKIKIGVVVGTTSVSNVDADFVSIEGTQVEPNAPLNKQPVGTVTTDLKVNNSIISAQDSDFKLLLYEKTGNLKDIVLKDLKTLVAKYCVASSGYYISGTAAATEFCDKVKGSRDVPVSEYIMYLNNLANKVSAQYNEYIKSLNNSARP